MPNTYIQNRLEGELATCFKIFLEQQDSCIQSACQPDHRKQPTAKTAGPMACILSQSKSYFHPHEPFLFQIMILDLHHHHDYFHLQCLAFFFVKVCTFDGLLSV